MENTVDSVSETTVANNKKIKNELHAVDFVGNGTYRVSQLNLLQKRSVETNQDRLSKLSARGWSLISYEVLR